MGLCGLTPASTGRRAGQLRCPLWEPSLVSLAPAVPRTYNATNPHSAVPCPPVLLPVMNSWREKQAQMPRPTSSYPSTQHARLVSVLKVGFRPQLQHSLTPSVDRPLHTWPPVPLGSLPCQVLGGGAPHPLPASAWPRHKSDPHPLPASSATWTDWLSDHFPRQKVDQRKGQKVYLATIPPSATARAGADQEGNGGKETCPADLQCDQH